MASAQTLPAADTLLHTNGIFPRTVRLLRNDCKQHICTRRGYDLRTAICARLTSPSRAARNALETLRDADMNTSRRAETVTTHPVSKRASTEDETYRYAPRHV